MGQIDSLIKEYNRKFKESILAKGIAMIPSERIPFSSPRANYMLYGGIPRGRLVEFAGEESSGKTTTALDIVGNAQKLFVREWQEEVDALNELEKPNKTQQERLSYLKARGAKIVLYADCENTLDEDWAKLIGVDVDSMLVMKPMTQTAEQIFEMLLNFIETDEVGLVVIDSLGVMLSAQAYEKTMEEKTYGGIAAALTLFSKKAELSCSKFNCTLIGINQVREDMNSSYGGLTTTGGKGWKHNCSVRLLFKKGAFVDEKGNELKMSAENPVGNLVKMSIVKTKVCKPDRRVGYYTLKYDAGVDVISDIVDLGIALGIVQQSGSWFNFVDLETGEVVVDGDDDVIKVQGRPAVLDLLKENTELKDFIVERINKVIEN
ncbi:AAA family ATPase [Bacteroides sp.]|uniref:AAA family ATPase n=1 Tax=Bacteroides sp. TaxID=29523 RepID=UPI002614A38F|nr:AAA family ATPase [Bacteroides sp.]MDD3039713.1 AAA family ATPase [Bacteroides sp.]